MTKFRCTAGMPCAVGAGHWAGQWVEHLEEGDDVLKIVQLQDVGLALGNHSQRHAQQHVWPLLLQQHVDDAASKFGREGAGEAGQEPLRCVQHRQRRVLLREAFGTQAQDVLPHSFAVAQCLH